MDPTAALLAMLVAARQGDLDAYDEHAEALYVWLRAGGFLPPALDQLVKDIPQPSLFS